MSAAPLEYGSEAVSGSGKLRVTTPRVETYSYVIGVRPVVNVVPPVLPLFTFSVADEVKRLRKPLLLRIALEDNEYFVENDGLNIFGHGPTLPAAIESFARDLAYYWKYYSELSDDQVAGEAVALKKRYESLVA